MPFVKGALKSGKELRAASGDKPALYAFIVDEGGQDIELLSNTLLGGAGELIEVPISCVVRKDKEKRLLDRVTYWAENARLAAGGGGGKLLPGF